MWRCRRHRLGSRRGSLAPTVVIVEDDATIASSISSYLKKLGIEVLVTQRTEEARSWLKEHRIKLMIVDCLLPGESGVDFVQSIRKQFPAPVMDVILMSGIFVEPHFMKESIRATQAVAFLKKPFDLEELKTSLGSFQQLGKGPSPRKALYSVYNNPNMTAREYRRVVELLEDLHGFDLPFIYLFLQSSRISGHLNIISPDDRVSGITFSSGFIVHVDLEDSKTHLGKLLIESGFILPDDLESVLSMKSSKRIGERLIQSQMLSPHGFEIVLANQMSIRLSRTILDETLRVNFVASEVELTKPRVDETILLKFVHDWIASKVTVDWLRAHFTPWGNSILVKGPHFRLNHPAFSSQLLVNSPTLIEEALNTTSLNELLEKSEIPEETLLKSIHFLICAGVIVMREKPQERSLADQQKHIKNVQQQFHGKNQLEIYDLMVRMTTASEQNPMQVFNEFMLLLGRPPTDKVLAQVYGEIKKQAENTYETVRTGSHLKLKDELAKQEIENKIKSSNLFEQAKGHLNKASFGQALKILERVHKLDPKFDKVPIYLIWAKLGNAENAPNRGQVLKEVEADMLSVAPEDKFDALFHYVTGLYQKAKGDTQQARKNFEKAAAMDGSFLPARREMAVLAASNKPKQDIFNQDLKTLVGSLFQRKK
ncbi:MAG: response regulator [Bdellovibrio sp.]|nr:MAG: response regulator [Bdellovibrio sp.]